MYTSSIPLS